MTSRFARVLALLSAVILAIVGAAVLAAVILNGPIDLGLSNTSNLWHGTLDLTMTKEARWIIGGIAGCELVLTLLLVWSALATGRRLIALHASEGETVYVSPSTLEDQLEDVVRNASEVEDVKVAVHKDGDRSVMLDLEVGVARDAEVGTVVADVQRRLATALATKYGVSLARKPRIEVRYATHERHQRQHRGSSGRYEGRESERTVVDRDVPAPHT